MRSGKSRTARDVGSEGTESGKNMGKKVLPVFDHSQAQTEPKVYWQRWKQRQKQNKNVAFQKREKVFWKKREATVLTAKRTKSGSKIFIENTKGEQRKKSKSMSQKSRGTQIQMVKMTKKNFDYWKKFVSKIPKAERRQQKGGEREAEHSLQRKGRRETKSRTICREEPTKHEIERGEMVAANSLHENASHPKAVRAGTVPKAVRAGISLKLSEPKVVEAKPL